MQQVKWGRPPVRKKKSEVVPVHITKAYEGVELQLPSFQNSELDGGQWSARVPAALPSENFSPVTVGWALIGSQNLFCRSENYFASSGNWTTFHWLSVRNELDSWSHLCYIVSCSYSLQAAGYQMRKDTVSCRSSTKPVSLRLNATGQ
jgi:hypothetical protein